MSNETDEFVKEYLDKGFFKVVPQTEVNELKNELKPMFRTAWNEYADRIQELLNAVRKHTLDSKESIVMKSINEHNCVDIMSNETDEFVKEYLDKGFFKVVPQTEVNELKNELKPMFRTAWNEYADRIQELLNAVRKHTLDSKESIVMKSINEHNCVDIMSNETDEFVKEYLDKGFFKVVPQTEVNELKNEL
jgi:predicted thioesterase